VQTNNAEHPQDFFIHLLTPAIDFDIIYQELNIP